MKYNQISRFVEALAIGCVVIILLILMISMASEARKQWGSDLTKSRILDDGIVTPSIENIPAGTVKPGAFLSDLKLDKQGNVVGFEGSDYSIYDNSNIAYSSDNVVLVTGFDATDKFQIGDKIRIDQGGDFKYFYIIGVTSGTLTLDAGSDYTFNNDSFTNFGQSRLANPQGFPTEFDYTATIISGTLQSGQFKYSMTGRLVRISGSFSMLKNGSAGPSIQVSYPFILRDGLSQSIFSYVQDVDNSPTPAFGEAFGDSLGTAGSGLNNLTSFLLSRADGVNYDASSLVTGNVSFSYVY